MDIKYAERFLRDNDVRHQNRRITQIRAIKIDGYEPALTEDLRYTRLNVETREGRIVSVDGFY